MNEGEYSDNALQIVALKVSQALKERGKLLTAVESCTGGWIGQVCTSIPGSSEWFDSGFVTYSNRAKRKMLGIDADILARHGAVSERTARAMAEGALAHSTAQVALAVTGIAGPDGGTPEKPVGTVCFAWAENDRVSTSRMCRFSGNREAVRRQSVAFALEGLLTYLTG